MDKFKKFFKEVFTPKLPTTSTALIQINDGKLIGCSPKEEGKLSKWESIICNHWSSPNLKSKDKQQADDLFQQVAHKAVMKIGRKKITLLQFLRWVLPNTPYPYHISDLTNKLSVSGIVFLPALVATFASISFASQAVRLAFIGLLMFGGTALATGSMFLWNLFKLIKAIVTPCETEYLMNHAPNFLRWDQLPSPFDVEVATQIITQKLNIAILLLDDQNNYEFITENGTLYVNWMTTRKIFSFDGVEIRNAIDRDVESFIIQIGNNSDEKNIALYKDMVCVVKCTLTENTIHILKNTFGKITIRREQI